MGAKLNDDSLGAAGATAAAQTTQTGLSFAERRAVFERGGGGSGGGLLRRASALWSWPSAASSSSSSTTTTTTQPVMMPPPPEEDLSMSTQEDLDRLNVRFELVMRHLALPEAVQHQLLASQTPEKKRQVLKLAEFAMREAAVAKAGAAASPLVAATTAANPDEAAIRRFNQLRPADVDNARVAELVVHLRTANMPTIQAFFNDGAAEKLLVCLMDRASTSPRTRDEAEFILLSISTLDFASRNKFGAAQLAASHDCVVALAMAGLRLTHVTVGWGGSPVTLEDETKAVAVAVDVVAESLRLLTRVAFDSRQSDTLISALDGAAVRLREARGPLASIMRGLEAGATRGEPARVVAACAEHDARLRLACVRFLNAWLELPGRAFADVVFDARALQALRLGEVLDNAVAAARGGPWEMEIATQAEVLRALVRRAKPAVPRTRPSPATPPAASQMGSAAAPSPVAVAVAPTPPPNPSSPTTKFSIIPAAAVALQSEIGSGSFGRVFVATVSYTHLTLPTIA